jgi:hypothetical protein
MSLCKQLASIRRFTTYRSAPCAVHVGARMNPQFPGAHYRCCLPHKRRSVDPSRSLLKCDDERATSFVEPIRFERDRERLLI